jgi:hypothetical protein
MKNFKTKFGVLVMIYGILSFIHLFGIEKAIFAIISGSVLLADNKENAEKPSKFAIAGILLGFIYIIILLIVVLVKGPEFLNMIKNMR